MGFCARQNPIVILYLTEKLRALKRRRAQDGDGSGSNTGSGPERYPLFSIIYKLFWAVFLYFAFLSYALIGSKKKLFRYGIQRWKDLVPLYIIIGAVFYAVNFIAGKILGVVGFSIIISLLLGLVLLAPVFVFGRIFLLQVVEE